MNQAITQTSESLNKKITVRILAPLLDELTVAADLCFLRRDALLDRVIADEIGELDAELVNPNPPHVRACIEGHLKRQLKANGKQLSIALKGSTVDRLETVCVTKNVPRDAFINRLMFLLAAPRPVLNEHLFGISEAKANELDGDIDQSWEKLQLAARYQPLEVLRCALIDPLRAYRQLIEQTAEGFGQQDGLYTRYMDDDLLVGLNCFAPDECIPGRPEFLEAQKKASAWLLQSKR